MIERQRKPRIDLVGYENDYVIVERAGAPDKWIGRCKSCAETHEQSSRQIQKNKAPMSCENFKPHNWSGLEKEDARLQREYGITQDQLNALIEFQDNKCGICMKDIGATRATLNVDHDHRTGMVRGVLCSSCNTALGRLGDNVEGVRRALYYLENQPFSELFQNALAR
jgi:hypothetical protein